MKTIHTGLASFGMSGLVFHGPCLNAHPGFRITKILERSKSLSEKHYPAAKIVRSFDGILTDSNIDLVVVNTPDEFHYTMCRAALLADKHVLVEKPFTQYSWQAEELISLAKEKGKCLTVFQNRRLDGDFLTVQRILSEGHLGRLVEFESHFDRYRNFIQESWKEEDKDRNGVLYNLGSHMIDQALVLFGKPLSVTAHLRTLRTNGKVPDYYDIRLQYNGFAALLKCSYLVRESGPRYMVHGTLGSFQKWGIDPQEEALKNGFLPDSDNWGHEPENLWGLLHTEKNKQDIKKHIETVPGNYMKFYSNLYEALITGAELMVKPEEALLTLQIMEHCLKSNEAGKTLFL